MLRQSIRRISRPLWQQSQRSIVTYEQPEFADLTRLMKKENPRFKANLLSLENSPLNYTMGFGEVPKAAAGAFSADDRRLSFKPVALTPIKEVIAHETDHAAHFESIIKKKRHTASAQEFAQSILEHPDHRLASEYSAIPAGRSTANNPTSKKLTRDTNEMIEHYQKV